MPKSSLIISFFLLCFCSCLNSQSLAVSENLVVNPSFEMLNEQVHDKVLVKDSLERIVGWKSPTIGRAEIYNTDKNGWVEDKTTISGQRNFKARTGQRVARITTYSSNARFGTDFRTDPSWYNYHFTYLQNELSDSMVVGKKYYIGFWSHFHCLGTNNIGMVFSTSSVQSDTALRLTLRPSEIDPLSKNAIFNRNTCFIFILKNPF
jgi:hypothetical protein